MSSSSSGAVVLKLLVVAATLMLGIVGYLFLMQSRSVLYRYFETGNPTKEPAFVIFNPFRDRQPERVAEFFLGRMKDGECKSLMSGFENEPQYLQDICERENTNSLRSWSLRNRTDEAQSVKMFYQVDGQNHSDGQLWLTVEKRGDQWLVTRYDRIH